MGYWDYSSYGGVPQYHEGLPAPTLTSGDRGGAYQQPNPQYAPLAAMAAAPTATWKPPTLRDGKFTSKADFDLFMSTLNPKSYGRVAPGEHGEGGNPAVSPSDIANQQAAESWGKANGLYKPPRDDGIGGGMLDLAKFVAMAYGGYLAGPAIGAGLSGATGYGAAAGASAAAGSGTAAGSGALGAGEAGAAADAGYVMPGADAAASGATGGIEAGTTGSTLGDITAASAAPAAGAPAGPGTAGIGGLTQAAASDAPGYIMPGAEAAATSTGATAAPGLMDTAGGMMSSAGTWMAAHPGTTLLGALTALGALTQKKPPSAGTPTVGQGWIPAFHASPMNRTAIPYTGDYTKYGQPGQGGEHQFFDNVAYNPSYSPGVFPGAIPPSAPSVPPLATLATMHAKGGKAHDTAEYGELSPLHSIAGAHFTTAHSDPLVHGPGGGQDDKVPAWLANGEYVFDASTVSDLGDGSTEEGARRLDHLREQIRLHKRGGAKGLPPKAKPTASYLRGAK